MPGTATRRPRDPDPETENEEDDDEEDQMNDSIRATGDINISLEEAWEQLKSLVIGNGKTNKN